MLNNIWSDSGSLRAFFSLNNSEWDENGAVSRKPMKDFISVIKRLHFILKEMGSCWRISNRVTRSDLHIRKSHSGGELENGLDEMELQARRPVRSLWRYSKGKVKRVSTMSSKLLIFSSNLSLELQARLFTCLFTSPGGGLIGFS